MTPALKALALALFLAVLAPATSLAAPPDPMDRGPYTPVTLDPLKIGTVDLQEPNAAGGGLTGGAAAATVQLRGSIYYPGNRATGSPVIVLVHGNHSSCDSGSAPNCTAFKRNDRGYAYLGENLASWGYTVASIDQDQLMYYQDGTARGMHQRRIIIAAMLDKLWDANTAPIPAGDNANIGGALVGKLDFSRVGLMGHSRGGDAVSSFIDYNRTRPAPGRKYNLRGVIALAPVDYERRAPYGVPFMTMFGYCEGDVTNLQGARLFERSQYIVDGDPFPRIQVSMLGVNHNWFNSVWFADGDDATGTDTACGTSQPNNIRLSGGTYNAQTRGSGDPALMGDQEKAGLALMSSFFRRYVGGDAAFDPYMTGELGEDGVSPQIPVTACPTSTAGTRIPCVERNLVSYFAEPAARRDVLRPETDNPLTVSALGTAITGSGFANPYIASGGVSPLPATTAGGFDWCNPEPIYFTPSSLGFSGLPTATKGCPLPAASALGGQSGTRENAPVNHSYGMQLALAWEQKASISTRVPAASGDVTGFKTLTMGAGVNFFDPRNPPRSGDAIWNPTLTTQDFEIVLVDKAGTRGTVSAGSPRYGNALHQTTGSTTARTHIVLNAIRVPLGDFKAQGVDLTSIRKVELIFGENGKPPTGSIQLSDVRFQEAVGGSAVYTDKLADVPPTTAPVPAPEAKTVVTAAAPAATVLETGAATTVAPATEATKAATCAVTLTSAKVKARILALKGATGCGSSLRVTIARVGKASTSKAVRATVKGQRWTASAKLAAGRYKVTVAGASKLVTVR
ncbi:alpha/beta hydrolase [Solirubrobacter phytolaccae]|uniref:Alpha/beta hydrolase n=1 Tax=Solirubrobacter phytolaccae TaxID=1404360 RepID=A0A9X3NCR2_9ACTN|nr:alpha/beta hydrolase [Solirubrobacter phytolaccae]MDA0184285.1 alpha/beta hydrolase [Solirubrobacter phytolaccae]